jgi:hypothetical protein
MLASQTRPSSSKKSEGSKPEELRKTGLDQGPWMSGAVMR